MKSIFLDVDGVLNLFAGEATAADMLTEFSGIATEPIQHLNTIIRETGAQVVISATCRKRYDVPRFNAELRARGFVGTVIGRTPELWRDEKGRRYHRGDEIGAWLRARTDVDSFVILDDDADMCALRNRLVKTESHIGLTHRDALRAIDILRELPLAEYPVPQAVAVITELNGRFAAIRSHERRLRLSLPGGRIEPGESAMEAAIREAREETGLEVCLLSSLGVHVGDVVPCEAFIARCSIGELRESPEGPVCWATREDILAGAYPEWSRWAFERLDLFKTRGE